MNNNIYYDGTTLLNKLDLHGNKPEIYMVTSNRSAGKTTYFNRLAINRFKKHGERFCLLYRFDYELTNVSEKFFKDIHTLFFKNDTLTEKKIARGKIIELYLNKKLCGYAVALNNADAIKKHSHYLSDVQRIIFDEFQSETNNYCSQEIHKFISIHTSIARGQNKMVRYVPVYMISNPVTLLNPYFAKFGIASRLKETTKYLKGDGWILEQNLNKNALKSAEQSAFNRAFATDKYIAYSSQGIYLTNDKAFLTTNKELSGKNNYICTFKVDGKEYALREYTEIGLIYVSDKIDRTAQVKISVTTEDHEINYFLKTRFNTLILNLRYIFECGNFRFKNLDCKSALLKLISYD